jgi:hypothetical protein
MLQQMMKRNVKVLCAMGLVLIVLLAAGCGGSGLQRIPGLTADGVVKTFFDAAKAGNLNEASLYISPNTVSNPQVVLKYLTGQTELDQIKNSNLLSIKVVAQQGDFAVVVATLQPQQNNLGITVKPVGLERLNGEWYIVDLNQIYQDAKYRVLQQLLSNI